MLSNRTFKRRLKKESKKQFRKFFNQLSTEEKEKLIKEMHKRNGVDDETKVRA